MGDKFKGGWLRDEATGALVVTGPGGAAVGAKASEGVGPPATAAPDGSTYFEKDVAGQTIAVWLRAAGAWVKKLGDGPRAALTRDAALTLTTATLTLVPWNVETEDDSGMHDPADNTKLTVGRAGVYEVHSRVEFVGNATGRRELGIRKNGTYLDYHAWNVSAAVAASAFRMRATLPLRLAVGDVIEVGVYQNSGANLDVTLNGELSPKFSLTWIRS